MAYSNPVTGTTRDKYGNEVKRDPTGTDPRSHTNYWVLGIGALLAAALLYAIFGMDTDTVNNPPVTNEPTATQPVTPKATPPNP